MCIYFCHPYVNHYIIISSFTFTLSFHSLVLPVTDIHIVFFRIENHRLHYHMVEGRELSWTVSFPKIDSDFPVETHVCQKQCGFYHV